MIQELKLPELGEGLETAIVLSIRVAKGDRLEKDQAVLELENEKATAEVPSPYEGTVREVLVGEGDEIRVGQTLMRVETADEERSPEPGDAEEREEKEKRKKEGKKDEEEPAPAEREAEDADEEAEQDEGRREAPDETEEDREAEEGEEEGSGRAGRRPPATRPGAAGPVSPAGPETTPEGYVPAGPATRRLARELGLDISAVLGSGPQGRISLEDVKEHARQLIASRRRPVRRPDDPSRPSLPDPSRWGPVHTEPQGTIRRKTAEAMTRSWSEIPMVTHHDRADITELEEQRERFKAQTEEAGGRMTLTAVVVKVVAMAVRVFPRFNAVYDPDGDEVTIRGYVNVAAAVDTEHGLLVPVVRDADRKSVVAIAVELTDLARKARKRALDLAEMQGAGITVSNVGGLGTTDFSPIVNWPQVAIVGVGRAVTEAFWNGDAFAPRLRLPLSLTYDHRVNDGADASRFLRWIAEGLERPVKLVMEVGSG